jgi:cell wall-associated NlpC family hydrolase
MTTSPGEIIRLASARVVVLVAAIATLASCTSAPRYTTRGRGHDAPRSTVTVGDATVSVSGHDIVGHAQDYVGTPYRVGGTSSRGMDCSGLVYNVFKSFGIALPRTSRDQARFGKEINRSELRAGDLVFFNTSGRGVSHVGIYSGSGEFIHASTRARRVRFDRLENKYFKNRFVVARRVL